MENNQPITADDKKDESIFTEEDFALQGYDKHIRQARNAIFTAAAILAINLIILVGTIPKEYEYLWVDISVWSLFVGGFVAFGFWTKKKPYYAIIGALILYSLFIILNAVVDVSTILKGIIFKIIIIVVLVKGLSDARTAQDMKSQING